MKRTLIVGLLSMFVLAVAQPANADVFMLSDAIQPGFVVFVGDKTFTDWDYFSPTGTDPTFIDITTFATPTTNPGFTMTPRPGTSTWSVVGPASFTDTLRYTVSITDPNNNPKRIKDNSLFMTLGNTIFDPVGSGSVSVDEFVIDGAGSLVGEKHVFCGPGFVPATPCPSAGVVLQNDLDFAAPLSTVTIEKIIEIQGLSAGEFAEIAMIEQRFSQTPEPTTLLLFGVGMMGVGIGTRRRKKS